MAFMSMSIPVSFLAPRTVIDDGDGPSSGTDPADRDLRCRATADDDQVVVVVAHAHLTREFSHDRSEMMRLAVLSRA